MDKKEQEIEQQLSEILSSDEQDKEEVDKEVLRKLPPRYEMRIETKYDPVAEETKLYRKMAKEVDDRYKKYD